MAQVTWKPKTSAWLWHRRQIKLLPSYHIHWRGMGSRVILSQTLIERASRISHREGGVTWISRSDVDQSCHAKGGPRVPLPIKKGAAPPFLLQQEEKLTLVCCCSCHVKKRWDPALWRGAKVFDAKAMCKGHAKCKWLAAGWWVMAPAINVADFARNFLFLNSITQKSRCVLLLLVSVVTALAGWQRHKGETHYPGSATCPSLLSSKPFTALQILLIS